MNCRENRKLVSLLIDGELDEKKAASVRGHMADCQACAEFYTGAASLQSDLETSLGVPIPRDLTLRVKASIAREREKASHVFLLPRWVRVPLMAVLVIAAVGLGSLAGQSLSGILHSGDPQIALEVLVPTPDPTFAQALVDIASLETSQ